jgi:hypothetical protein
MKPSLADQVTAVELMCAHTRGNMDIQRNLIRQNKRDDTTLKMQEGYYPSLLAAAGTMRWMLKNENLIKKLLHDHRAGSPND